MNYSIKMPKLGLKMSSGVIVEWLKHEGETVKKGVDLLEIETEKVSYVVKSPRSGKLLKILAPEMSKVPVNQTIAIVDTKKSSYRKKSISKNSAKLEK